MEGRAPIEILAVGDVHLGRRSTRLPEGRAPRDYGPLAAFERTIEFACEQQVDLVLLAGDLIECIEDRFEAYAHLERAARALADSGIPFAGVAGNHDVEALPRLADRVPSFRLLGRAGKWERARFDLRGGALDVLAWSFADRRCTYDPLGSLPAELAARSSGVPAIGLLHGDLDQPRSSYAPLNSRVLARVPVDAWLLGHVHKPHPLSGARPIGYLGSLCGLDPGEAGLRGPRLVEIRDGTVRVARTVPVARVRYEGVELDVAALDARHGSSASDEDVLDELAALQAAAYRELRERLREEGDDAARLVLCRPRLCGTTAHFGLLSRRGREVLLRGRAEVDAVDFVTEEVRLEMRTALDLERLARGDDPPGLLARRLIALRDGDERARPLLERARAECAALAQRALGPVGIAAPPDDEERLRALLLDEGTGVLHELLAGGAGDAE